MKLNLIITLLYPIIGTQVMEAIEHGGIKNTAINYESHGKSYEIKNKKPFLEATCQLSESNFLIRNDVKYPTSKIMNKRVSSHDKSNVTLIDSVDTTFTKVNCLTDKIYGPVEVVNYTRLMELLILDIGLSNRTRNSKEDKILPGLCIFVMFYAKWCIYSSQAAPHINAIPRFYPHLKVVAIDAMKYQNFNTQYGIVGVPTLMLIHNAKPIAKFNETTYNLENFSKFIMYLTNLQSNDSLYVTSADFSGPVSSIPSNETDYCLVLSGIFIVACLLYFSTKSQWWRQLIELVQNTWRESNAQHEHVD